MKSRINRAIVAMAFFGLWSMAALAAGDLPQTSHDGLQLVPSKDVEVLYLRPGASLEPYKRVAILDCFVAFRKNWQREQNSSGLRVSSADMNRIKKKLAEEFNKIFVDELQNKGGYEVVDEAGEDVLILRPAIIDLDISSPDTLNTGMGRSFSTSAGEMTLYLEVLDGGSGEIQARIVDGESSRDNGRLMWQNSITNRQEADRLLRKWAALMRGALDRARASGAGQPAG